MNISMIVAMGRNHVIGKDNDIPWKLPAEQQYFKKITMGHAVVGGRKNFESMKRPLKGRRNFILTRNQDYKNDECEVIYSAEELLKRIDQSKEEIFIIGGEEVYRVFMPYSNKLYITIIEEDFEGDTYFPAISDQDWVLISEEKGITDEKNPYVNFYRVYERRVT